MLGLLPLGFMEDLRIIINIILFVGTWQWFKSWTGSSLAGFIIAAIFTYLIWMRYYWFALLAVIFYWGMGFWFAMADVWEV